MIRMPLITDTPRSETNPIAAEMLKFKPAGQIERQDPPLPLRTEIPESARRLSRIELNQSVEQRQDQQQTDRHNIDREPRLGLLQLVKLSGPDNAITRRQMDIFCNPRASASATVPPRIALAHAELDRDVAFVALAVDIRCSGIERDVGKFTERNVGVDPAWRLIADLDLAHRVNTVTISRSKPDRDGKLPLRFQKRRRHRSAQCSLNH